MDRKTILVMIIFVGIFMFWSFFLFPPSDVEKQEEDTTTTEKTEPEPPEVEQVTALELEEEIKQNDNITLANNIFDIKLSNLGGIVKSIKLKDTNGKDETIEMVYAFEDPQFAEYAEEFPFSIHFGDYESAATNVLFQEKIISKYAVMFTRSFEYMGIPFTLKKTYELKKDDYIIELRITFENMSEDDKLDLNFEGVMYTLGIGPQIGPEFKELDGRYNYRKFGYYKGSFVEKQVPEEKVEYILESFTWAAIVGKYFTLIGIPSDVKIKGVVFDSRKQEATVPVRSAMYFERKKEKRPIESEPVEDTFQFYVGPKKKDILAKYNKNFEQLLPSIFLLGPLAELLKYPLDFFFSIVGNYGIAIILLTILIKLVFFPLTRKSFESMGKLQALSPKMNEIKQKYKDNPQKMNAEIAQLYRKEGVNPLGGCLPYLIQIPIMFALYFLLSDHFELRGAIFIPGWITDLSRPESVFDLPFVIPILGWQNIRLLPFIMLGTQVFSSKITQRSSASTDSKMKYLPYILVGVFFFILYNLPSGLVLYWTMQNILTVLQMVIYNKFLKNRPPKPKKKRFLTMQNNPFKRR